MIQAPRRAVGPTRGYHEPAEPEPGEPIITYGTAERAVTVYWHGRSYEVRRRGVTLVRRPNFELARHEALAALRGAP